MVTVNRQRELVANLKRETSLNVGILNRLRPMSSELSRQIFRENALEKPTQSTFNHFSYYLVTILDAQVAEKFSWPLYDTKTERAYRNQLSVFINDYSSKGLFSPVMSSYLVNPGCYKVTMLMFQMSLLAVQRTLKCVISKNSQKELYSTVTEKYKTVTKGFVEDVEKERNAILEKLCTFLKKREAMHEIAAVFQKKIIEIEKTLASLNAQKYIDNLVDTYVSQRCLDETTKAEILSIKDVSRPSPFFDKWLEYVDESVKEMNATWDEKVTPFLKICTDSQTKTEALIARYTGETDRNSYIVEYNHSTDEICTKELQNQVNTQQKYILKNIIVNERLNFPNLIRGFLISICYILKNTEVGDEIYKFNEYMEGSHRSYKEIVLAMRILNDRVMSADAKILPSQLLCDQSVSVTDFEIPPLPDLSDVKASRVHTTQVLFDTFTPLSTSKHQFNLCRKYNSFRFSKPQSANLITPFHQAPRDDFLKNLISCRVSNYDQQNVSHNFHNISVIPQVNNRANETIAECSSGFTKQQIMRLLSTKKSSSSKKFKYKTERPNINIKKGGLFNDSNASIDSNGLFRSFSSPNLFENREKRSFTKLGRRKLSIMREDSPTLLEVSGIVALAKDDTLGTPDAVTGLEGSRKLTVAANLPIICITHEPERKLEKKLQNIEVDLNIEIKDECPELQPVLSEPRKSAEIKEESKTETPKTNAQLLRKTSSLEKIINRFKKVRASVLPCDANDESEFKTIVEEKENMNLVNVDVFTANRILLPDLLSPSCSALSIQSTDYLDQLCMDMDEKESRKPRQSLGTALGVDNTFLDQFDLID